MLLCHYSKLLLAEHKYSPFRKGLNLSACTLNHFYFNWLTLHWTQNNTQILFLPQWQLKFYVVKCNILGQKFYSGLSVLFASGLVAGRALELKNCSKFWSNNAKWLYIFSNNIKTLYIKTVILFKHTHTHTSLPHLTSELPHLTPLYSLLGFSHLQASLTCPDVLDSAWSAHIHHVVTCFPVTSLHVTVV